MLAAVPWIAISLIVYDIAVFAFAAPGAAGAQAMLQGEILTIPLMSGADWSLSIGDVIILLTLVFLFVELMKAARRRGMSITDQALSTIVLIVCILHFLMVERAATSVFLIITFAAFIDVIAGFFIALRPARRETAARTRRAQMSRSAASPPKEPAAQGAQVGQGSHG